MEHKIIKAKKAFNDLNFAQHNEKIERISGEVYTWMQDVLASLFDGDVDVPMKCYKAERNRLLYKSAEVVLEDYYADYYTNIDTHPEVLPSDRMYEFYMYQSVVEVMTSTTEEFANGAKLSNYHNPRLKYDINQQSKKAQFVHHFFDDEQREFEVTFIFDWFKKPNFDIIELKSFSINLAVPSISNIQQLLRSQE